PAAARHGGRAPPTDARGARGGGGLPPPGRPEVGPERREPADLPGDPGPGRPREEPARPGRRGALVAAGRRPGADPGTGPPRRSAPPRPRADPVGGGRRVLDPGVLVPGDPATRVDPARRGGRSARAPERRVLRVPPRALQLGA